MAEPQAPPAQVHSISAMPTDVQIKVIEIERDIYENLLWVLKPLIDGDHISSDERARGLARAIDAASAKDFTRVND